MMNSICVGGLFLFVSISASAQITNVKLNNKTPFTVSTWMDEGSALPKSGVARTLALLKKSSMENDKKSCAALAKRAYAQAKSVRNWISVIEMKCALLDKPKAADLERLIERVRKNPEWLTSTYFAKTIRPFYVESLVRLSEIYSKSNRARAWFNINEALSHKDWLGDDQKADVYRFAGEISFVEQNLLAAKNYFDKSLQARESSDLRKRLDSIVLALKSREGTAVVATPVSEFSQDPSPQKELELYNQMRSAINSKDYISAIEDGVDLLIAYPGGTYASDAEAQVASIYLSLATGTGAKWEQLKKRVLSSLKKMGGDRLYPLARQSYNRGCYQEAFELAEEAADNLKGQALEGDALYLAGKSAQASKEPKLAIKSFTSVAERHSGSPHLHESLFRLGLVYYKKKDFSEAVALFERLLTLKGAENYEYRSLYWAWRSLQVLKLNERAAEMSKRLIERYPMTLYGMKALAEQSDQKIQLKKTKPEKIEITLRLMPDQIEAWNRFPILLSAGWFEEAQIELSRLPTPESAEEYLLIGRLYSLAQGYVSAIGYLNRAFELNPEYAYQKEYLAWIFPSRFKKEMTKWSASRGLDPLWVQSLIRQESAFQPRAVSRSNALGLMQLIPSTAQEVARDLKKTKLTIPESVFDPDTNIEMGTHYVKKMLSQFGGQLPFALAAYNAGPTRLKRWMDSNGTQIIEDDIWVDELPWSETSFYVKSILRNILIFELLDKGQIQLNSPIWQISSHNP